MCAVCGGGGGVCRKQWMLESGSPQGPPWLSTEHGFPPCCPQPPTGCSINWGPPRGPDILSPTKPALDLRICSRTGALSRADSFERGNPWRWDCGRGRGGGRGGGVPFPHSFWDLFWGQRGKPRLGPLKQEKLELALNSERVCWGLASRGLPQASRQAVGLCLPGSQAAGQAAASSLGS